MHIYRVLLALLTVCLLLAMVRKAEAKATTDGASPEFVSRIEAQTSEMKERLTEKKHQKAISRIGR